MKPTSIHLAQLTALLLIAPTFCDRAAAQVPEGSAIVGTYSGPISSGASGLFMVPLAGGPILPVTGLPPELQQVGGGSYQQGVGSVGYRTEDGAIVVGTVGSAASPMGGAIELFLLHLNGSAVDPARTRQILLGTTGNVGGALVQPLPDGRILVTASDAGGALTTGPMANHLFAIVDVSAPVPAFTLLPTPPGSGVGGGMTVDPTGQFVYYLLTTNIGSAVNRVANLHRWDLVNNAHCVIANWPGEWAKGVFCDDDGTVYVSANDGTAVTHIMHAVHPDGCNSAVVTSQTSSLPLAAAALALDRASGRFVVQTAGWAPGFPSTWFNSLSLVDATTGAVTVIASPPAGGWGLMSASVAVNNAIDSYGPRSDGQNHYWFENFANPGGQPTIGNSGFSLTMRALPNAPVLSFLALSLGRGSMTIAGVEVLVDVSSAVTQFIVPGLSVPYSWSIPNDPAFSGLEITAQSIHLEANNGLGASRGLTFTIQ